MRLFIYALFAAVLSTSCAEVSKTFTEGEISIVPKPRTIVLGAQSFSFSDNTSLFIENDSQKPAATFLSDLFEKAAGFSFSRAENQEKATVVFLKDENIPTESYHLEVTPDQIIIKASGAAGYFYGVQTIRQLLPPAIEIKSNSAQDWLIPSLVIIDEPRFSWRGMHMDFSRHFFSVDEVKTFLDYMALFKLNTYHMHLTDDQG